MILQSKGCMNNNAYATNIMKFVRVIGWNCKLCHHKSYETFQIADDFWTSLNNQGKSHLAPEECLNFHRAQKLIALVMTICELDFPRLINRTH